MCRPPTFGLNRSLEENDLASMIRVVLREADELCVSRIARFFDRRVVQSILRKAGDRAANVRVQLAKGIDRRYSALVGRPQPLGFDSGEEAVMAIRRRGASRFYDEWMAEQRLLSGNVECYAGQRGEQTPR